MQSASRRAGVSLLHRRHRPLIRPSSPPLFAVRSCQAALTRGSPTSRVMTAPRQVARLAADWQPRSCSCPTVGTSLCLALCLRHSGTVTEQEGSVPRGFVSWSKAAYHVPRAPCPSCHGLSERQRRASLGNTSQNAARRAAVCYMHGEQVGSGLTHGTEHFYPESKQKIYAGNGMA